MLQLTTAHSLLGEVGVETEFLRVAWAVLELILLNQGGLKQRPSCLCLLRDRKSVVEGKCVLTRGGGGGGEAL